MASRRSWERILGHAQEDQTSGDQSNSKDEIAEGAASVGSLEDDRPPMFRLLRFYAVASAIAFIVISVLLVVADRLNEFEKLISAVERQNVGVAHSFANIVWPRFSDYATTVSHSPGEIVPSGSETQKLRDAVLELTGGLPVMRIKVYDLQARTIFSSNSGQIGTLYENHPSFLSAAGTGSPRSRYFHSHEFMTVTGPVRHRDLVESYLPIWGDGGRIDGILEIYTDITQDLLMLDHRTVETAIEVTLVFSLLYVLLFLIVKRANTIVERQYERLLKSRGDLDRRNAALFKEIANREALAHNLHLSEQRFRSLSDRLIVVQEEERTRVSRELHDGIGQGLTDIRIRVERAMDFLLTRSRNEVRDCLESIVGTIRSNMEEVRRIAMGLRPSLLDDLGILATLSWACRSFQESYPRIEIVQNLRLAERELPESVKIIIYRTLQEGLNNIARHSGATRVRVSLYRRRDRICFTISDNGRGMSRSRAEPPNQTRPRLGLYSLRERALQSSGTFQLRSISGIGTTIRLTWPLGEQPLEFTGPGDLGSPQRPSATKHYEGQAFS